MIKLNTGAKIKTHEELGITFREWAALFGVAQVLHAGIIPMHRNAPSGVHAFNLETSCRGNGHCGTVGCIGGYVALAMGKDINKASNYVHTAGGNIRELYFPSPAIAYDRVTQGQAAQAIGNFLTTGNPMWRDIIPYGSGQNYKDTKYKPYRGKVKDHTKLGITFVEWMALMSVRAMLETGAIKMVPDVGSLFGAEHFLSVNPSAHVFNMGMDMVQTHCGTVGCIGGYMGEIMGRDGSAYTRMHEDSRGGRYKTPLSPLFYPDSNTCWNELTAKQAVRAIDNFLTTGKPNWRKALAG
jgi:hypothetical protein